MAKKKLKDATELTLRGLFLGTLLTFAFTAANVYLGLKVGLTFNSSIPAAVISMAVLSVFRNATILENNIVQTVASAAGTLSAIIFVLPGLVIIGTWAGFPFWTSFLVCAAGGTLGVLFTIPLRRAFVTYSDLPYPEGVAAAEVLKVGSAEREGGTEESREGLLAVIYGSIASAGFAALSAAQIAASEALGFFRFGPASTGYHFSFSLALFGAGHLVGISVGLAFLLGLVITWGGAVPILTMHSQMAPGQTLEAFVMGIRGNDVRFIGAGCIAVAALWTLLRLARPVINGFQATIAASRTRKQAASHDARDTDLSGRVIFALTAFCLAVICWISFDFAKNSPLADNAATLTILTLPFVILAGFVIAAICGYMAGLIGSSNSPVSGVGILAVVACATLFVATIHVTPDNRHALVAFALFVTAIVLAIAIVSNDNLQDLKTGQLVGATPWRQQVALIVGVIAGSAIIPPVLNLLAQAYGFAGQSHLPSETLKPLGAPQANLISALATGVIGHNLSWKMIEIGAAIGVAVIALDEFLRARNILRLPPLAVGLAIYLPMGATLPVVVGALAGYWYNRLAKRTKKPKRSEKLGVLVASGLIVGESLFGVTLAGLIVGLGQDAPLALVPADFEWATLAGVGSFIILVAALYGWMKHRAEA